MFSKNKYLTRPRNSVRKRDEIGYLLLAIVGSVCCSLCSAGTENLTKSNEAQYTPSALTAASAAAGPSGAASASASAFQNAGARTVLRVYDECSRSEVGFVSCLKKKAISFIDRISHIDAITVADGMRLVRSPASDADDTRTLLRPLSENELESSSSTSRSGEDRDQRLTNMLIERVSNFFNGHTLQVSLPKLTAEEIGRGLEEGRGKMKKMMGMMVMGMAMKMMGMLPIAMGGLYMLAGKALIISKIALLLAGIMGLKKLMSGRGGSGGSGGWSSGGGGGGGGGWSSGGGGGGGGWDRRSLNEAQDLAYRGYGRQQEEPQQQPQSQYLHVQQKPQKQKKRRQQGKHHQMQLQKQQPPQLLRQEQRQEEGEEEEEEQTQVQQEQQLQSEQQQPQPSSLLNTQQ